MSMTLFFVLIFTAVFIISQALILPAAGKKVKHIELTKRLNKAKGQLDSESITLLNDYYNKSLSPIDRKLVSIKYFANMKKMLELAGVKMGLGDILARTILICLLITVALLLTDYPWYLGLVASVIIISGVIFYINWKINSRLEKFEEQLPEALDIMRRMLQAGQPLTQAFREVGDELPNPAGEEFKHTFNLLNFGYDLKIAILSMADRVPTVSMLAFSSAVLLQKDTGGNLAENLQKVSVVLRARFKLARKIKTLSAESRMGAWILVLAPFVLFMALYLGNREFVEPLWTDPRGIKSVIFGMVSLLIGAVWIKKVVNIEV